MERKPSYQNNFEKLLIKPPIIYHTSRQEIAFVGKSLNGIIFTVQKNETRGYWEQVKFSPDGKELVRAQITNGIIISYHEMCLYAQHCPGGEFYDRLRLATRADFNDEIS